MQVIQLIKTIEPDDPPQICDVLAKLSGLSKGRNKKAMNHGAVWHRRPGRKNKRMRRASMKVKPGDLVSVHDKESMLNLAPPTATCVRDLQDYCIWRKPAGLMTQGTLYGDRCTLSRQIERHFNPRRNVYLVHHLDRETERSLVSIRLITGRRHQIRRHFNAIGYPVMGAPRNGHRNKNNTGLLLHASGLSFECPPGSGLISVNIEIDQFK